MSFLDGGPVEFRHAAFRATAANQDLVDARIFVRRGDIKSARTVFINGVEHARLAASRFMPGVLGFAGRVYGVSKLEAKMLVPAFGATTAVALAGAYVAVGAALGIVAGRIINYGIMEQIVPGWNNQNVSHGWAQRESEYKTCIYGVGPNRTGTLCTN